MGLKVLHVALQRQDYDLAAHTLVYGLVKAKAQENDRKKGRPKGQSKRS